MKPNQVARRSRLAKQAFFRSRVLRMETLEARLALHGGGYCEISASDAQTAASVGSSNVNQAPFFTKGSDQTVLEDSGKHCVRNWATGISAGSAQEQATQALTFVVTTDNPQLFSSTPRIKRDGTLLYTLARNANGIAKVSVRLKDNGGTANGGSDTSPLQSFTITVRPVNDRPEFLLGKDQIVLEDSGPTSVANWAKFVIPGPKNESSQAVNFIVSNNYPTLFSAAPTISSNGTLSFTPAPNAHGKAKVTVRLKDDGGTANGGRDTSRAKTFTITVRAVNDAPSFVKGQDQFVAKGSGLQRVQAWATSISAGAPNEFRQKLSFIVSTNNRSLFASQPTITDNGTLRYKPAHGAVGTATVTVRLKDDGGRAHGGQNTSPPQTFTINIGVSPNVAPSFTVGPNQVVLEDSGPASIPGWASAISPGPAHESNQTVSFLVSSDNASLFTTPPSIASNGTLTYTPAPNAFGSTIVTVIAKDSGGTTNGGVDTSAAQSFTITVAPVNDAPSFTKGLDQTVSGNSGPQTVTAWATGLSPGPDNESTETISFLVSNDNTALFDSQPSIAPNGTLTYTPAANAFGSAIVTVAAKDSGGTTNGGKDTSATQTFTINILSNIAIVAELLNDTAPDNLTNVDRVTFDPRIAGNIFASAGIQSLTGVVDSGAPISIAFNPDGSFVFDPPLARDGSADGEHLVRLTARDVTGNQSSLGISFTLDTRAPAISPLSVSAASGFVTPQSSTAGRVTLLGTTVPGGTVRLLETGATALANNAGSFQFLSVPLVAGDNLFTVVTSDAAGNIAQLPTVIRRVSQTAQQDPVLRWNQAMLEAVQRDASAPTFASRGMAMVHTAIYDAVSAIEQKAGYYVSLAAPAGASLEAAVTGAAHRVLSYLYPGQQTLFDAARTASLAQVPDGPAENAGLSFGQSVGDAVIGLRASDGWNDFVEYVPGTAPGDWRTTEPLFAVGLDPHWADLDPFSGANLNQLVPSGPPSLSSLTWANAFNETKSLGRFDSTTRTADQTQIARFWANGPGTTTPPGHWNSIAQQVALAAGNSIAENARLFAMLGVSLADAAIVVWQAKYQTNFWRPITAIQSAETDNNELTSPDTSWQPLLITPNFPDYVSGHSTFSSAAATVLTSAFGQNYSFSTSSPGLVGVNRSFASFEAAAAEAGRSRIYGGIHYEFSNQDGIVTGKKVAEQVLKSFTSSTDGLAPKVIFSSTAGRVISTNQAVVGRVLDNLSGVKTLTAAIDGGAAVPVAFDALGNFTFTPTLPLTGAADGAHRVSFIAEDFQGNISSAQHFDFTLDTQAPSLDLFSPVANQQLATGDVLEGVANGTGSTIVELKYSFTGQPARTIPLNATTGAFSETLNFAALPTGATTLTVVARDAAGFTSTVTRNLNVVTRAPFTVEKFMPLNGARDVGSTYRPQVFFSRAVNPTTLNANNFYATGPNGAKLAANIVPAGDGSFAWLFFTQPMPSASQITVHIDGATILAAGDGTPLDADGDGTAGGRFTFKFSTVSLTPLLGTTLSGKVVEAGPDLKPMTFDDIRVGPDQVLHTADDLFLTPLAGVKVFILGLENQFVLTDAQGNFSFASAPAGNVKLAVDGRTATNAPVGTFFPEMVMDLNLEAGRANTVMGTMGTRDQQIANRDRQEVYLPRLQTSILKNVSGAAPTVINVDAIAAPNITAQQRAQLTLEVQPGSMRDQNGNLVSAGQVGISTVPPELVREMLPPGLLQHTFDITVQAPGVTNFATPAPMTFPNTFGAKPGEQLNFLSFDHTTGRLVIEGTATVSADGLSVRTDPGTGITHPGWHGLTPQGSQTSPDDDEDNDEGLQDLFSYTFTQEVLADNSRPSSTPAARASMAAGPRSIGDTLLMGDEPVRFTYKNTTPANRSRGSYVLVKVTVPSTSLKYLDGLTDHEYKLRTGALIEFKFAIKPPADLLKLERDVLIGAKFKFEAWEVAKDGTRTVLPETGEYYVYRYVDAMDDETSDGRLYFPSTIVDSQNPYQRVRAIEYRGDRLAIPNLSIEANQGQVPQFTVRQFDKLTDPSFALLQFAPNQIQSNNETVGNHSLQLLTPTSTPRSVAGFYQGNEYDIRLFGDGVDKRQINLNKAGLEEILARIANGQRAIDITFAYDLPPGQDVKHVPTKFALTYQGRSTPRLSLQVDTLALYVHLTTLLGFSNVEVSVAEESLRIISGPLTGGKHITRTYRLEFPNVLQYPSDPITVAPATGGIYKSSVKFDYNNGGEEVTLNEIALIDTEEKRATFATKVLGRVKQLYADFSNTIVFHDSLPATNVQHSVDWITVKREDAFGRAPSVLPLLEQLQGLLAERRKLNPAQFGYKLAMILAAEPAGPVQIFVDNFFALSYPFYDVPEEVLIRSMAKTTAHELAHSLGMMHNAEKEGIEPTDEQQVVDVSRLGPDDFFRLNFAGEKTETLRPGAIATEVQAALRKLNAFRDKKAVTVLPDAPGRYKVNFVLPKTQANPKPDFHGIDLPELRVIGPGEIELPAESVVTTVNGGTKLRTLFEILNTNSAGVIESTLTDILASGPVPGEVTIQEKASRAGLRFSARGPWTANDKDAFVSQMLKVYKYTAQKKNFGGFFDAIVPNEGESAPEDDSFQVEGRLLELFTSDPNTNTDFASDETDFGSGSVVTPSIKRFSLANLGSENATIRSISITKGAAVFSTSQIPVTVLAPGESLEFEVKFAPNAVLDYEGTLSIDSDMPEFNGEFDLVGNGQPPNIPSIHLSANFNSLVPFFNNLGGAVVGQQTSFTGSGTLPNPMLTNNGTAPLVITEIRVAQGQGFGEWMTTPLTAPITLQPGESTRVDMSFRASKPGLRPGAFEVVSNDPRTPVLRIPVVATGVITNDNGFTYEGVDLGNDYVVVGDMLERNDNLPDLRTRSDDAGNWEFFLPAETGIQVTVYDPVSGLVSISHGITNATGINTLINPGNFIPSVNPDTDGDGLPDDVEFAIGTNENKVDTDGDGKNDFAELDGGFNPIDDRPAVNGVVSALSTGTSARDIKLAADFTDPSRTIAFLATSTAGLSIADVTDFARPITIAQLGTTNGVTGSIIKLSLDVNAKIVAAASTTLGVHLVDVANTAQPKFLRTLPHEGTDPVAGVELYDGLVYVGVGSKLRVFEVDSGELSEDIALGTQRVLGLSRSGDRLYVTLLDTTNNQHLFRLFDITLSGLVSRGSIVLPNIPSVSDPYIADGVAWIPAGNQLVTVNVTNPNSLQLISGSTTVAQFAPNDFQLNGSGIGVVAGRVNASGRAIVLQTPNPTAVGQIFTQFNLPAFGEAIALNSGLAYIATGNAGLQLVNFLQRDVGVNRPTIELGVVAGDINPSQPGLQMVEGSSITIPARITDDVQVRSVELLVNGVLERTELSYPYDLTTLLPTIAKSGSQAVVQLRATDTGGNIRLSDPIVIDLVRDTTAPVLNAIEPANGSTQSVSRRKVTLQFSESLDPATIIPANFQLQGPSGVVVPISVTLRQRDTRVEILYPPLAEGAHTFTIRAALVKDRADNAQGTSDVTSTFTIAPAVRQPTIRWVNDAGGQWATASNWRDVATNTARVPTATDDVLIDVPTDAQITLGSGVITVNSVISNERFQITGGRLNVTDTIQVNNSFVLRGSSSNNIATLKATVLRGAGGEGLTIGGESRLDAATIQTDIALEAASKLRLANGLALQGTLTVSSGAANLGIEGSQIISSGNFVTLGDTISGARLGILPVGVTTLTIGQGVTFLAQLGAESGNLFNPSGTNLLSLVNRGTITALGTTTNNFGVVTRTESLINHGVISTQSRSNVGLGDKTIVNSATGRITIFNGQLQNLKQGTLGFDTTTTFTNAGTLEFINTRASLMTRLDGLNQVWSNTGTIIVDRSVLELYGSFTSNDVVNVNNTGVVLIQGQMDNVGRTFTFNTQTKSYTLASGRIRGGTLVMGGPTARLEFAGVIGAGDFSYLDGVTLRGDTQLGGPSTDVISGITSLSQVVLRVQNGLTLDGTMSIFNSGSILEFRGPQSVSGGTIQFVRVPTGFSGSPSRIDAQNGGPVSLNSTLTIRNQFGGSMVGNFINNATTVIDANSTLLLEGGTRTTSQPFINRSTITLGANQTLTASSRFSNEGQIVVNGGTLNIDSAVVNGTNGFINPGVINQTSGQLIFREFSSGIPRRVKTSDLGTLNISGGSVFLQDNIEFDNTNASLPINGTSFWNLVSSTINGGTIQVNNTAQFTSGNGVLRDVIVNGNTRINSFGTLTLVGDLDFNGNVTNSGLNATLQLGHESLYVGVPLIIRGGSFDLGANGNTATITGTNGPSSISLEPDAVLKGRRVNATFSKPLTNRGQIIADQQFSTSSGDLFHFTTTPLTNQGTLSAINRAILRINNLAAPSSGIISSAVGSLVEFTGAFAQTAAGTTRIDIGGTASTQFGRVTAGGAASLAGNLNVQFATGFTPTVGNRFQVLNYASRTGQFDTISVTGLANGLVVTPEYNATNLTLVVSAVGGEGEGGISPFKTEYQTIAELKDSIAFHDEQLTLAPTILAFLSNPVKVVSNARILNDSNEDAVDLMSTKQPPTEIGELEELATEIDDAYSNVGHESSLHILNDSIATVNYAEFTKVHEHVGTDTTHVVISSVEANKLGSAAVTNAGTRGFVPSNTLQSNDSDSHVVTIVAGTGVNQFPLYETVNHAIGIALEHLIPLHTKRLASSASAILDYPRERVNKLLPAEIIQSSSGVTQEWTAAHQPPTKPGSTEDTLAAIDEVFGNIEHELLLIN